MRASSALILAIKHINAIMKHNRCDFIVPLLYQDWLECAGGVPSVGQRGKCGFQLFLPIFDATEGRTSRSCYESSSCDGNRWYEETAGAALRVARAIFVTQSLREHSWMIQGRMRVESMVEHLVTRMMEATGVEMCIADETGPCQWQKHECTAYELE